MAAPQNFVSVSRRPPDVEDYIDMMRRYRSWIIGPAFAGLVISVVVAFVWPNLYLCTAAMQIKPGTLPTNLLPSMVAGQMNQRLQQLNLEILGRDNLIALIQNPKLDLYKKERQRYSVEDVAEDTFRKDISIFPYNSGGGANNGAQAFKIVFKYTDRYKAQTLVRKLVTDFTSKNVVMQNNNSNQTTGVFDDLVKTAKEKMEKAQIDLAAFT